MNYERFSRGNFCWLCVDSSISGPPTYEVFRGYIHMCDMSRIVLKEDSFGNNFRFRSVDLNRVLEYDEIESYNPGDAIHIVTKRDGVISGYISYIGNGHIELSSSDKLTNVNYSDIVVFGRDETLMNSVYEKVADRIADGVYRGLTAKSVFVDEYSNHEPFPILPLSDKEKEILRFNATGALK